MAALDSTTATIPESTLQDGGLSEATKRVTHGHERLIVTRRGKPAYVLVPVQDLALLEEYEEDHDPEIDRLDAAESGRRMAAAKAQGEKPLTLAEFRKAIRRG